MKTISVFCDLGLWFCLVIITRMCTVADIVNNHLQLHIFTFVTYYYINIHYKPQLFSIAGAHGLNRRSLEAY